MISRVIVIVLDGVGIGALPDAQEYGDQGSDTLGHIINHTTIRIPHLYALGLKELVAGDLTKNISSSPKACYGKLAEKSPGKDSITGHWELMGLILDKPFPTYPHGFPDEIISAFKKKIGRNILGNKPASGTAIITELGDEHVKTGFPIVYTSADSVFQVAAHESVIPIEKLYEFCRIARRILAGRHGVGRVIARPFTGTSGIYKRISGGRKDFSIKPPGKTILNAISDAGMNVVSVGKIIDIFSGSGITASYPTKDNVMGIEELIRVSKTENKKGLILGNLIDFDMLFGHRNNVEGFTQALEYFDKKLPEIMNAIGSNDVLIITADHGCDPTFPTTDHTREYVPILVTGMHIKNSINIGMRESFADVGATIIDLLGLNPWPSGKSFYHDIFSS